MIDEQSLAIGHDYALDHSAIGADCKVDQKDPANFIGGGGSVARDLIPRFVIFWNRRLGNRQVSLK